MVKGISETEKTKEGRFLPSLIPVLINNITRKEISETEKKQEGGILPYFILPLIKTITA